jgi:hypothetical protein
MILPTKHLSEDRALLGVGAEILRLLDSPKTVSRLWDELKHIKNGRLSSPSFTYDWFILSLNLLYTLNAIELERGRVRRSER